MVDEQEKDSNNNVVRNIKGTVRERVNYFQTRQDLAEARRLEEEELFNSRTRISPTIPHHDTPNPDVVKGKDDVEITIHVPTLVDAFEKDRQPVLTQPHYEAHHLSDKGTDVDPTSGQSWPLKQSDDFSRGPSESQYVDEMIHEAEKRLKSESLSLEGLLQQVDRSLKLAESNSQQSSSSGDSRRRNTSLSTLGDELERAEQQYSRNGLPVDGVESEPILDDRDVEFEGISSESMERTKAMMADDDFVPFPNSNGGKDRKGGAHGQPAKNGTIVVGSFPIPAGPPRKAKNVGEFNSKGGDAKLEYLHKQASFEVPLEVTDAGLKLTPKIAELTMMTTIPPSKLGGTWSGSLAGKSNIGTLNESSGSVTLEYKTSRRTRLSMGMVRGFKLEQNLITFGGKLVRYGGSYMGIALYHHPTDIQNAAKINKWLWSFSYRHCFANTRWYLFSQLSRRQDVLLLMSNNKLSGRVEWNLLKANRLSVRVDTRLRLSEYRKAHVYCQWKSSVWQVGVSLVQSLHSQISTVGLGWRIFSSRGVQWIFSWNRGNATINIPITISKELTKTSLGHTMYLSLVSYLIQECVAEVWCWVGDSVTKVDTDRMVENVTIDPTKARRDAETQKELMARQARRKMKIEQEKDGLVIQHAVYEVTDGDKVDVTLQLQFWVSHSTLTLPARPKSELLGFYDVTASLKNPKSSSSSDKKESAFWSWKQIWCDLIGSKNSNILLCKQQQDNQVVASLTIQYTFKGKSYSITVNDREELRLPSPQATVES